MSTQRQRKRPSPPSENVDPSAVSEEAVVAFLREQPDFFERHPGLLAGIKLPHNSGSAVSLVERQVSILRQRNAKTERKLRDLVSVARANETLSGKIHALCLRLMRAADQITVFEVLEKALHEDFGADQATLVLLGDGPEDKSLFSSRFVRRVGSGDPALKAFQTFMSGSRPRCGQMRDVQREFLFGQDSVQVGSAALVPLGEACALGMLAIGNHDSTRFHPAMSTDFLARLGEVLGVALSHYPEKAAA